MAGTVGISAHDAGLVKEHIKRCHFIKIPPIFGQNNVCHAMVGVEGFPGAMFRMLFVCPVFCRSFGFLKYVSRRRNNKPGRLCRRHLEIRKLCVIIGS